MKLRHNVIINLEAVTTNAPKLNLFAIMHRYNKRIGL
jgi:hypothetical protein